MSAPPVVQPKQHVTSTAGVCGGKPCIAGTRVWVWDVASLSQAGQSPDEILAHYPHLTLADVYAALAYYYDNREEIDRQAGEDERLADELLARLGPGPLESKARSAKAAG